MTTQDRRRSTLLALSGIVGLFLILSGIHPYERLTWALEIFPVLIAFPLLALTYRRFPLTNLAYVLIFVHALILIGGGHSTYARNPLGNWVQDVFGLERNPYDRLGHFAQGFVPAILAREILLRTTRLERGKMLFFLVVSVCLFVSVSYEFIEWWSALILGQGAEDFLGTQGDVWDTQWDLFLAFVGAVCAQGMLAGTHDGQLKRLER